MALEEYKISVIVPVYNAEGYLEKCVCSLLEQTHKNMEIILVDDGSKDNSGRLCDWYAKEHGNVIALHKENGGSSSARNLGIQNATGDYIAFCDSDDYVEKDMYLRLLSAALDHPEGDICQIRAVYHSAGGEALNEPEDTGEVHHIPSAEMFRLLMLHLGDASFCTKLIRRSFMQDYRFSEGKLNEDFELILAMIQRTDGVWQVDNIGYHIVLSDNSNTRGNYRKEFFDAMISNSDVAYKTAKEKYPEAVTEARRFQFYQRLDYLLHIPVKEMKHNEVCDGVIRFLRENKKEIQNNPFLSEKEKRNLRILMQIPRLSRRLHGLLMKMKGTGKTEIYTGAQIT
ncbi:MAG: glycosyltransferase family 2 protein [Lachnospiraceae bacterium]|nr:glycosyltransferase family 2 protein [Lachnospiraceae bacterium]